MSAIAKPILPDTVIRFQGAANLQVPPSAASTVAIPIVSDWGPVGADPPGPLGISGGVQALPNFNAYTSRFGDSDTPGRTAAAGAFAGQGLPGLAGAGELLVYRMAGGTVAAATKVINKTGGGASLTLTAVYKGARGNLFSYTVDVDPANAARDRLRLYYDGNLQETYLYANTDINSLAAAINLRSKMVTAVANATGTRLIAQATPSAFTGGDSGLTIAGADHLAALAALEQKSFGIAAPFDLTDPSILASYLSWVQERDTANAPVRLVVGGAAGETIDTALARTVTLEDPHVVNFGVGTWHDDLLDKDLSTSQLAPRVAGILAANGQSIDLTFRKIGGLHNVGGTAPSKSDMEAAVQGGVVVLGPVSSPVADVHLVKGVTTYTGDTTAMPQDVFGDSRLVGIIDNYVRDMKQWGDDTVIGAVPVNDDSRAAVRGHAKDLNDALLAAGLILPGDPTAVPPVVAPWVVCEDPHDPALADALPYTFGWQFAQTANAILGQGNVL